MLAVLGALIILGGITLTVNRMLISKTTDMLNAETSLVAVSIAQTMIDEIQTKSYDLATAGGAKVYDSTAFTSPSELGPSSTESHNVPLPEPPDTTTPYKSISKVTGYNDVDDYNGYTRKAYSSLLGTFTVVDTVYYVSESNPNQKSSTQTFYKKIIVTVRHPNMSSPLQLSDIAVYRRYF